MKLVTLPEAIELHPCLTVGVLRSWIRSGALPATRVGKGYAVDVADLEAKLRPQLREPRPRETRETPTARARRQLREAGVAT